MCQVLYICDSVDSFIFLSFSVPPLKISCLDFWFTDVTGARSRPAALSFCLRAVPTLLHENKSPALGDGVKILEVLTRWGK